MSVRLFLCPYCSLAATDIFGFHTPVWMVNATTANLQVKSNGKGESRFSFIATDHNDMLNLQIGLNAKGSNIQTGLIHQTDFETINEAVTLVLQLHCKIESLSEIKPFKDMFHDQLCEALDDANQTLAKMEAIMGFAISSLIKEAEGL